MSKNKSSATTTEITPEGEPKSSFITNADKTGGGYGDMPIMTKSMTDSMDTEKSMTTEDFGSKGNISVGETEIMPEGRPSKSFINTSAVK